jgi:hypothetical protein
MPWLAAYFLPGKEILKTKLLLSGNSIKLCYIAFQTNDRFNFRKTCAAVFYG